LTPGNATRDHVHPLSKNGKNTLVNVVCSCRNCNLNKADKTCQEANMFPRNPAILRL